MTDISLTKRTCTICGFAQLLEHIQPTREVPDESIKVHESYGKCPSETVCWKYVRLTIAEVDGKRDFDSTLGYTGPKNIIVENVTACGDVCVTKAVTEAMGLTIEKRDRFVEAAIDALVDCPHMPSMVSEYRHASDKSIHSVCEACGAEKIDTLTCRVPWDRHHSLIGALACAVSNERNSRCAGR